MFFWLALHRRLWTSERRWRHGLQDCGACTFCGQELETVDHLLLGCVCSRQVWMALLFPLGLQGLLAGPEDELASWWIRQRRRLDSQLRTSLDSVVLLVSWIIWKERNSRVFREQSASLRQMLLGVIDEGNEWLQAGFLSLGALFLCPFAG